MPKKWVRRKDGVIQRYNVKKKEENPVVNIVLDRYNNLYFIDPDEPGAKLTGTKKVFEKHPELYGYLLLFESIGAETGKMMDDGHLPKDLKLTLKIPLNDYQLLIKTGIMKPEVHKGNKVYRINPWVDADLGDYPWKGQTWVRGVKDGLFTEQFLRKLSLMIKKRASIKGNKRIKDIKNIEEYKDLGGIFQYILER